MKRFKPTAYGMNPEQIDKGNYWLDTIDDFAAQVKPLKRSSIDRYIVLSAAILEDELLDLAARGHLALELKRRFYAAMYF